VIGASTVQVTIKAAGTGISKNDVVKAGINASPELETAVPNRRLGDGKNGPIELNPPVAWLLRFGRPDDITEIIFEILQEAFGQV
jgi:hypothetical protein